MHKRGAPGEPRNRRLFLTRFVLAETRQKCTNSRKKNEAKKRRAQAHTHTHSHSHWSTFRARILFSFPHFPTPKSACLCPLQWTRSNLFLHLFPNKIIAPRDAAACPRTGRRKKQLLEYFLQ